MNEAREGERSRLLSGAKQMGIDLTAVQIEKLLDFLDLLQKWNKAYNLTAVRDRSAMLTQHLLDSLSIVPHLPPGDLLDVGSGGGLPGIPLAILQPERSITLVDTVGKKVAFLKQAAMTLGLKNLNAVSTRIETWNLPSEHLAGFAVITARAYATLDTLIGQTKRLLAPNGGWYAMKGVIPAAEMAELTPDVLVRSVISLQVPDLNAERHLIVLTPVGSGS